jgi:hypothetical protein
VNRKTASIRRRFPFFVIAGCVAIASHATAFEGRIDVVITQGNETTPLLYTVGENFLRIEVTDSDSEKSRAGWPHPIDIVDLKSGALTLVFPHNRSFVRLKGGAQDSMLAMPGAPALPLPPGIGPQSQPGTAPAGVGQGGGGPPHIPAMPMMPPMPMEKVELKATGEKKEILGFACTRYELKQHGETLEVWATDKLLPFQQYVRTQPPSFGPRRLEEQWAALLSERRLFPLIVSLRYDHGVERFRFEVKSVKEEKIADPEGKLFRPPPDYHETEPLPFS